MQEVSLEVIREKALGFHEKGIQWHFHCMTPQCFLNEKSQHAFVLESAENKIAWVHFSDQLQKALAAELSPLLHGSDVMDSGSIDSDYVPSEIIVGMRTRALELNEQGIKWHHHMLYPECVFNFHSPSHVLMLEDSLSGEAILSITADNPINDLKQIENLFFKN